MKYVISFTICLCSVVLVHGQSTPKKPKSKRAKSHVTAKLIEPAKTELDEVVPSQYPLATVKKVPIEIQKTITQSKPMGSVSSGMPKSDLAPSVFSVRSGTPQEDEMADLHKTVAKTQPDFDETEISAAKIKLATSAPLQPESVVLESNPFAPMPGERIVLAPAGTVLDVPKQEVKNMPKVTPIRPAVVSAAEGDLATRGAASSPIKAVAIPAKVVETAVKPEVIVKPEPTIEVAVKAEVAAVKGMAIMSFEHKTRDLGRMRLGESKEFSFPFTNKGDVPIEIELMDVCPCTTLDWDRNPIAPGATSVIKASFHSQKVFPEGVNHEIEKVITIILKNTDPRNGYPLIEELKLKAFVEYQFQD
jgi:hypothetical protein